jgi:hypothetical protein
MRETQRQKAYRPIIPYFTPLFNRTRPSTKSSLSPTEIVTSCKSTSPASPWTRGLNRVCRDVATTRGTVFAVIVMACALVLCSCSVYVYRAYTWPLNMLHAILENMSHRLRIRELIHLTGSEIVPKSPRRTRAFVCTCHSTL